MVGVLLLAGVLNLAGSGQAQPTGPARLLITVTDPSGAVVPKATVTVEGPAERAAAATATSASTSGKGAVTFEALAAGRYTIRAEFPGFEPGMLRDVRVRSGDNRHVIVLRLSAFQASITVARDAQAAAADPRGNAFRTILSRQEIEALSDDPAEMAQQLIDMAGGNAVIRIDSFVGGRLPPKAQIKSIHIVRDAFAAENHSAESDEIDIITQPGVGPIHGGGSSRVRDGSMSSRSPFTLSKGPERSQNYEGNFGGTLVKNKSSFSISVERRRAFDTPNLNAALPGQVRSEVLNLRRINDNWSFYGLFDYAITRDQTLRVSYDHSQSDRRNLGVGAFDLPERAYATATQDREFRAQVVGPLGRRVFANTRVQIQWVDSESHAATEGQTIRVADAFTSGGAQVRGGRHPKDVEVASDVDYVRGIHTVRAGLLIDGGRYRSDDESNYLGTFAFTSLDAFSAGRPAAYTRRIGDPLIQYDNLQAGVYLQDDLRVRKGLTLSPGLRYETQTHLRDLGNLGPRFGFTWAPSKSGQTTLRGSWGIFYNWMNAGTYEQTLRVDGFRQQELNVFSPGYPDPGIGGTIPPGNRYLLGDRVQMPRTIRLSAGVDRRISPRVQVSASYSHVRASGLLRGRNLNAPVGGIRPDAAFANEVEVVSDARQHSQQLATTLNVNFSTPSRQTSLPRWNIRRSSVRFSYWIARAENDTDGAFSVPSSGTLETEWGSTPGDRRHRISASVNTTALRNLSANFTLSANSGTPYTITTGLDGNGDLIFNDRPAGVRRNSARTPWQATWSSNLSYAIGLGGRPAASRQERGGGDRGAPSATRCRLAFTLSVTNLANRPNFSGYSGVMTSPFFRRPTSVMNPRKFDLGMSLRF